MPDPAPAPNPDSPENPAERKARHLATLRELTELTMNLARTAAAKAAEDLNQPDPPEQPGNPQAAATPYNRRDHALAFTRLASAVRQTIALEANLASDDPAHPLPPRPDPRRLLLRHALHQAADAEPDRATRSMLRREIDQRIEDELCADPASEIPPVDILIAICDGMDLHLDVSKLPDELIGLDPPRSLAAPGPGSHCPGSHCPGSHCPEPPRPTQQLTL